MSESIGAFEPGIYTKGDLVREASSRAVAVDLVWNGFVRVTAESVADQAYADLQAQARQLGIPANQKKEVLAHAIADYVPGDGETAATPGSPGQVPETGSESPLDGETVAVDQP